MANEKAEFARLPINVVPSHYFLTIRPDIDSFTFSGSETVNVQVRERTKTIVLNSLDIAFQSATFVSNNQGEQCSPSIVWFFREPRQMELHQII